MRRVRWVIGLLSLLGLSGSWLLPFSAQAANDPIRLGVFP